MIGKLNFGNLLLIKESEKAMMDEDYGKELIIDLHNCNPETFTRKSIRKYFKDLCEFINMERCDLHWWDDLYTPEDEKETEPHLVGTSAIQFIKTSNITIHTLDILEKAYVNIFSCKDFNSEQTMNFTELWFEGVVAHSVTVRRM